MNPYPMISDPYMDYLRVKNRLRKEYREHKDKFIIAFDFDDTVFDTHNNDWAYDKILGLLCAWQEHAYLICWTASNEDRYPQIRDHLEDWGLYPDAINENAPWIEDRGRKIYANAYLDDRAGLKIVYLALKDIYEEEIANHD